MSEFTDATAALDWLRAVAGRTIVDPAEYERWAEAETLLRAAVRYAEEREAMMARREVLEAIVARWTRYSKADNRAVSSEAWGGMAALGEALGWQPAPRVCADAASAELALMDAERSGDDGDAWPGDARRRPFAFGKWVVHTRRHPPRARSHSHEKN